MKDNKGTTVLLTVIGIATLLVAVVGATFAYFTAGVVDKEGSVDTNVTLNSATVGTITFAHSNIIDLCDDNIDLAEGQSCVIYPGAQESKTFTITADANSTTEVNYKVSLEIIENTFVTANGLGYKVSATSDKGSTSLAAASSYAALDSASTEFDKGAKIEIGTGTLGTAGTVDTWTLDVKFQDTGDKQDLDQGAQFLAKIVVEATDMYTTGGTLYTTAGN